MQELGRVVRDVSDAVARPDTVSNVRKRLLKRPKKPAGRAPARVLVAAIASVGAAALILWFVAPWHAQAVTFTALVGNGSPASGVVGEQLSSDSTALELTFSDGSRVTLEQATRARITATTSKGADVLLEEGSLHAAIDGSRADRRWNFRAGPYTVEVKGTEFDTSWDPTERALSVVMQHGVVVVRGPGLAPRRLAAGERLDVRASEARSADATEREAAQASASVEPTAPTAEESAPPSMANPSAPVAPSWRELAAAGKHRDAMDSLDDAQFSALLNGASGAELRRVADVARLGGRPTRATAALMAMRSKGDIGDSAFLLGKIHADQLGSPGAAVQWFETYLSESPNGPLAEQALGRLLELNRHNPKAGRSLAERYLQRYPQGAYAALARRLRDEP